MKLLADHGISEESGDGPRLRDEGYRCARDILETNRRRVVALAEQLVERGQLRASEVRALIESAA